MLRWSVSRRVLGGFAVLSLVAALTPSAAFADELSSEVPEELVEDIAAQILEHEGDEEFALALGANVGDEFLSCLSVSMPTSFDLRQASAAPDANGYFGSGSTSYVTSVKDQTPWGTCWAFSAMAASESSILSSRGIPVAGSDPINLSEKHLAWFAYTHLPEGHESGQGGEGAYLADDSFKTHYDMGGHPVMAVGTLSSGIGPVEEGSDPSFVYGDDMDSADWGIDDSLKFKADYQLDNSNVLPCPKTFDGDDEYVYDENATVALKSEIMKGHAISVAICADTSMPGRSEEESRYINTQTWAHYCYEPVGTNHQVTIVGWDDSYSKEYFLTEAAVVDEEGEFVRDEAGNIVKKSVDQPPYDGAWIVRNSWGSDGWGEDGYFYLSYYDQSLAGPETFEYAADSQSGDSAQAIIDQYDFMEKGNTISTGGNGVQAANVFTAKADETLTAVSCETASSAVTVTYDIYKLDSDYQTPTDGTLLGSFTEEYDYAGYHRLNLVDEGCAGFALPAGTAYSVVVAQEAASGSTTMPVVYFENERYVPEPDEEFKEWCKGVVNEGESYACYDGEWCDWLDVVSEVRDWMDEGSGWRGESSDAYDFDNPSIKGYAVAGIEYKSLSDATVTLSKTSLPYTGKVQKPSVKVVLDGVTLKPGVDYSVSYSAGCKNAGTYTVTVEGQNLYADSQAATFKITQAAQTVKVTKTSATKSLAAAKSGTYKNKLAKTWTVNAKTGYKFSAKTTLSFSKNKVYVYSASKKKWVATSATGKYGKYFTVSKAGKVTVKKGLPKGSYMLYIKGSAAKTANYKAASKTVKLVVKVK